MTSSENTHLTVLRVDYEPRHQETRDGRPVIKRWPDRDYVGKHREQAQQS